MPPAAKPKVPSPQLEKAAKAEPSVTAICRRYVANIAASIRAFDAQFVLCVCFVCCVCLCICGCVPLPWYALDSQLMFRHPLYPLPSPTHSHYI